MIALYIVYSRSVQCLGRPSVWSHVQPIPTFVSALIPSSSLVKKDAVVQI